MHLIPSLVHIYLYICWRSGSHKKQFHKPSYNIMYFIRIAHRISVYSTLWRYMGRRNIATKMFPSFYWKVIHLLFLRLAVTKQTTNNQPREHLFCVNWAQLMWSPLRDDWHGPCEVTFYTFASQCLTVPQRLTNKPTCSHASTSLLLWCIGVKTRAVVTCIHTC